VSFAFEFGGNIDDDPHFAGGLIEMTRSVSR
jgi:hypothetical protein